MKQAVRAVISGSMGYKRAADQFQMPQTTTTSVFSKNQEEKLVAYLHKLVAQLFGLTIKELRTLALQLAKRNNLPHPFKGEAARSDWVRGFLIRHPVLNLRKPEATYAARAMYFNEVAVQKSYDHLANVVHTYHIAADRINNYNKTNVSVDAKEFSKIIAKTGR
ncbi:hypothetical protein ILUMI_21681 [Ignelater luminosus]|uniref:HTH CENPB-type domain-containing protein n=1 Tax=Ignelater luminosus TaxID=2038154 RepID=A0A8K0CIH0_IGNLU|nr:hypothetical protein ILUMI_21681 [Ignelater luminosus]